MSTTIKDQHEEFRKQMKIYAEYCYDQLREHVKRESLGDDSNYWERVEYFEDILEGLPELKEHEIVFMRAINDETDCTVEDAYDCMMDILNHRHELICEMYLADQSNSDSDDDDLCDDCKEDKLNQSLLPQYPYNTPFDIHDEYRWIISRTLDNLGYQYQISFDDQGVIVVVQKNNKSSIIHFDNEHFGMTESEYVKHNDGFLDYVREHIYEVIDKK